MPYTSLRKRFRSLPFRCNLGFGSRVLSFTTSTINARWETDLFTTVRSSTIGQSLPSFAGASFAVWISGTDPRSKIFFYRLYFVWYSAQAQPCGTIFGKYTQSTWFSTKAMADRVNAYKYLCRQPLRKTCTLVHLDWKCGLYSSFRCGSRPHNINMSNSLWNKLPAFGLSTMWRHAHLSSVPLKSANWPCSRRQCSQIAFFYSAAALNLNNHGKCSWIDSNLSLIAA